MSKVFMSERKYMVLGILGAFLIGSLCMDSNVLAQTASSINGGGNAGITQWPWTKFLNSLADQLTGPLPLTLGILGIAGAAIAMFTGNAGGATSKFIMLILAVSICLFAPSFIQFLQGSIGGLTIMGAM